MNEGKPKSKTHDQHPEELFFKDKTTEVLYVNIFTRGTRFSHVYLIHCI